MAGIGRERGCSTFQQVMIFDVISKAVVGVLLLIMVVPLSSQPEGNVPLSSGLAQAINRARPGDEFKVWVFFTGKDPGIRRVRLSPKCLQRRRLRGRKPLIDLTDLPISKEYIHQVLSRGAKQRAKSKWLNAISVEADVREIQKISALPFVRKLDQVIGFRRREIEAKEEGPAKVKGEEYEIDYGHSYPQLSLLNIPQLHRLGYDGSGVLVCLLDTGFWLAHECFDSLKVVATRDFIFKDDDVQDGPEDQPGQHDHGTSTLSVISGFKEGELIGPAFGASYALAKTEDIRAETPIEEDYWIAGLEWADSLGADVVSSSLGYTCFDDGTGYTYEDLDGNTARTTVAADLAVAKGMVVVTAAGNKLDEPKPWHYIVTPADGDSVLAVGAVDMEGNLASFSSVGPTADGRIKPDLMAPGVGVWSADARSSYRYKDGTSFSTPLIAGAVALLLQVDSTLTPMEVRDRLCSAGSQAFSPDNLMGWGVPDLLKASDLITLHNRLWCYPNPFRDVVNIAYCLSEYSSVRIQIFTVSGELVREMDLGPKRMGDYSSPMMAAHWRGENQSGKKVAPGIYLCRLTSKGPSQVIKIAYLGPSNP